MPGSTGRFLLLGLFIVIPALAAGQNKPAPQPPPASQKAQSQPPAAQQDSETFDPASAEEDIEVGTFYMHKGDYDAAISRFQDAIRVRSNFAKPRLLIAEAYEKKGDKIGALKYYQEYLRVFPKAPDAKKIQGKIEKLKAS
ncbi:MAG TPA: tetratricopeptide repeat protein [Candidatus Acidoferrales bacterium]|nr:tetratricopeptide repeat protein [Candidatus Acidoferrales bacterium]